jgi:outer membrane protein TolC
MKKIILFSLIFFYILFAFSYAEDKEKGKKLSLSLKDVSILALQSNFDIQIARYDAYIRENDLLETKSIFDTIISGKFSYTDDQSKPVSTIAGTKSLSSEYSLNIKKKAPTGTTVSTELSSERQWTNSAFTTINPSHNVQIKAGVSQELGKNFFGFLDRKKIDLAKLNIENSAYTSLDKIESYLAQIQKDYWKLALEKERLQIEKEMLKKAEELLKLHIKKEKIGLVERPQILASGTNLRRRENELLLAKNSLSIARDVLLYKLNLNTDKIIEPEEELKLDIEYPDYITSLKRAISLRRDYMRVKNQLKAKNIEVAMKKNSLWPEINLELSFIRNGLEKEYKDAFNSLVNEDNPTYFAGLSFSFSLENRLAKGELNKAELEKAKELLRLKNIERKIVTEIKEKVDTLSSLISAARNAAEIVRLQEEKLKEEERRFLSGRSDTDTLIRYQQDLLDARVALIEMYYKVKIAEIELSLAENSLLARYTEEKQ